MGSGQLSEAELSGFMRFGAGGEAVISLQEAVQILPLTLKALPHVRLPNAPDPIIFHCPWKIHPPRVVQPEDILQPPKLQSNLLLPTLQANTDSCTFFSLIGGLVDTRA